MVCFSQVKQHKKEEHGIILGILFEFKSEICVYMEMKIVIFIFTFLSESESFR